MRFTVFCIVGKKGVTKDELMAVSRNTRRPMDEWLRDKAFAGKTEIPLKEKDYYDVLKTITFEVGKEKIDRVLFIRGQEAKDRDDATSIARTYIITEPDQEVFCEAYESFEEIVDPANPEPEDDLLHYVRGSLRQRGYFRRRRYDLDHPSKNQRKARALFGRIAHDHGIDKTGKAEIVDKKGVEKEIPASAVPVMEKMYPVAPPKPVRVPISPVQRLRRLAEILARVGAST